MIDVRIRRIPRTARQGSPEEMYRRLASVWDDGPCPVLGASEPPTILTEQAYRISLPDPAHLMMYLDTITYLPDDILVKVDRASMGVSLEVRAPYLDQ